MKEEQKCDEKENDIRCLGKGGVRGGVEVEQEEKGE